MVGHRNLNYLSQSVTGNQTVPAAARLDGWQKKLAKFKLPVVSFDHASRETRTQALS
jgi:hypothetical protein